LRCATSPYTSNSHIEAKDIALHRSSRHAHVGSYTRRLTQTHLRRPGACSQLLNDHYLLRPAAEAAAAALRDEESGESGSDEESGESGSDEEDPDDSDEPDLSQSSSRLRSVAPRRPPRPASSAPLLPAPPLSKEMMDKLAAIPTVRHRPMLPSWYSSLRDCPLIHGVGACLQAVEFGLTGQQQIKVYEVLRTHAPSWMKVTEIASHAGLDQQQVQNGLRSGSLPKHLREASPFTSRGMAHNMQHTLEAVRVITGAPDIKGQSCIDLLASKMALCSAEGITVDEGLAYLEEMGIHPVNSARGTRVATYNALHDAASKPTKCGPQSGETVVRVVDSHGGATPIGSQRYTLQSVLDRSTAATATQPPTNSTVPAPPAAVADRTRASRRKAPADEGAAATAAAPSSAEDDEESAWVQCERAECRKWRRLNTEALRMADPAKTWYVVRSPFTSPRKGTGDSHVLSG
jgi:hypothetical protein